MALIITNGNTSLSTASGFYRVEAYNWGAVYVNTSGQLALTTSRTFDVTFSNSGNLQGVVICLMNTFNNLVGNSSTHCTRDVNVWFEQTKSTCTMTIASPCVVTNAGHGLAANQEIEFTTTGALPTGLTAGTKYYVRNPAANTFEVSATSGGASIATTGTQSGVHTLWAIRDSKTLTSSEIMNATDNSNSGIFVPFEMTTPYAVDTVASKWRYRVSQGSGSNNWTLLASSAATPTPIYAAWCDNAVSFTNNDSVIAKDVLTIDQSATFKGLLGAGNTTIAWALVGCRQATPTVADVANVKWQNPPSASYTLTIDGVIVTSAHTGVRIGTSTTPILYANQAIVNFISPTVGTISGFRHSSGYAIPAITRYTLQLYGSYLSTRETTLSQEIKASTVSVSSATPCVVTWTSNTLAEDDPISITTTGALPTGITASQIYYVKNLSGNTFNISATPGGAEINTSGGQSGVHTANTPIYTTDTTGWTVGSIVSVSGSVTKNSADIFNLKRTIATISGNLITLSNNLTQPRIVGGRVINWSEGYGIQFLGYDTIINGNFQAASNIHVEGVESRLGLVFTGSTGSNMYHHEDAANASQYKITRSSFNNADYRTSNKYTINSMQIPPQGFEISYNHGGYACALWYYGNYTAGSSGASKSGSFIVQSNYMSNIGLAYGLGVSSTSSSVLSPQVIDNYFEGFPAGYGLTLKGYGGVFSGNTFYACNTNVLGGAYLGAVTFYDAINFTGANNIFDNCNTAVCLSVGFQKCEFTDNIFGPTISNTNDIVYEDGIFPDYQENSPTGAVIISPASAESLLASGSIRIRDYNNTVGDYRSVVSGGKYYSSSGNLIGETTQTTDEIETSYTFLSGAISTFKLAAVVGCKIENANYYAGTYTLPSVSLIYGDDAAIIDSAIASTAQQRLIAISTPADDNKNIIITLTQKTDATSTDADVTWSDLTINTRKYGYIFVSVEKQISEIIPYIYGEVTTPVTNPFISEPVEATVAAYTGITVDDGTETITVSSNHTVNELYDYLQYVNATNTGMEFDEYFTTQDGSNYTCIYNLVIDNCALSGAGKSIDLGAKTLTLVGTATFDGKWIDSTGDYAPILITGLVSGSTLWIYDDTNNVDIYKAVVSSSSILINYEHIINLDIIIRVRKSDYISYEASNTFTENGMSQIVAQDVDDIYNEIGIDGSTVTECSLSGATIRIYVDDPDNSTRGDRIYSWYKYIISTPTYIDIQDDNVVALTSSYFKFSGGLKFINQDIANPLEILGSKITDTAGSGAAVVDNTNGASIVIVSDAYGLTATQNAKLMNSLTLGTFIALK